MSPDVPGFVTDRSRLVIAIMLVLTVVAGAGVPLVEQSTSLDQFQGETDESEALSYTDEHFASADGGGTVSQVIVRGDDVLSQDALLDVLDYQQAVVANDTANASLASDDPTRSVASAVATAAYVDEERAAIAARERELNATSRELHDALARLEANESASVDATFDRVAANASANLTDADRATFADAAATLRNASANDTATRQGAYEQGTRGVLADEYDALSADAAALRDGVDPSLVEQERALAALNETEVDALVERTLADDGTRSRVRVLMPTDYAPGDTSANATLVVVAHETNATSFAAGEAPDSLVDAELAMATIAADRGSVDDASAQADGGEPSYLVFGSGIVADETQSSMTDSLQLVGPLAIAFVVLVLVLAYRDLLDVALGVLGVGLVLVWTFGVMGWVGIAFNQPFIIVVVLLIGLSIDYAIHVVMRYREERGRDDRERDGSDDGERGGAPIAGGPRHAMKTALGSVGVALVLVTATTVIGFLSNLASPLEIFRQIGVVSAIGIVATLLVFGLLVPAVKVEVDAWLDAHDRGRSNAAIGAADGRTRDLLAGAASLAKRAPVAVLVVALLVSAGGAYGATQVDTSFSESDFLAEDPGDWLQDLPEPFAPGDYHAQEAMDVLNDRFVRQDTEATILVEGDVADPGTLDRLDAATQNASSLSTTASYANGDPAIESPLTVLDAVAAENATVNETLAANDRDGDGVPDENVTAVFDALYRTAPEDAATVLERTDDGEYVAMKATVSVDGGADGATVTDQMRWFAADVDGSSDVPAPEADDGVRDATADGVRDAPDDLEATATGQVVINAITADQLLDTVVQGLVVALLAATAFLVVAYRVTEGSATLGAVVVFPVALTVTWVLGAMWLLEIPFNIVTGLITSLTVGLGIDYSIHVGERFAQALDATGDVDAALEESVTGTGGALLSSAATTASGFGVLVVALLPFLQAFGVITALTIAFAFLASVFVLPSALALWARWTGHGTTDATPSAAIDDPTATGVGRRNSPRPAAASLAGVNAPADRGSFAASGFVQATPTRLDRDAVAVRSVDDAVAAPGDTIDVTVSVHAPGERVLVRERAPAGDVEVRDASPAPVRVVDEDDLFVLWDASSDALDADTADGSDDGSDDTADRSDDGSDDTADGSDDTADRSDGSDRRSSDDAPTRSLSYVLAVPEDAADGEELAFDGTVATADGDHRVRGDREVTVVADVFQRVLERGEATDDDVDDAATQFEAAALSDAEFERLCRAWLAADAPSRPALPASDD